MKANELMIGDKVAKTAYQVELDGKEVTVQNQIVVDRKEPKRILIPVTVIGIGDHIVEVVYVEDGKEVHEMIRPFDLNPIPLTEEILSELGFKQYGHHSMLYVNEGSPDEVSIHIDYKESIDVDAPSYKYSGWCEHFHNFQHVLRLCGLTDLADYFKLK